MDGKEEWKAIKKVFRKTKPIEMRRWVSLNEKGEELYYMSFFYRSTKANDNGGSQIYYVKNKEGHKIEENPVPLTVGETTRLDENWWFWASDRNGERKEDQEKSYTKIYDSPQEALGLFQSHRGLFDEIGKVLENEFFWIETPLEYWRSVLYITDIGRYKVMERGEKASLDMDTFWKAVDKGYEELGLFLLKKNGPFLERAIRLETADTTGMVIFIYVGDFAKTLTERHLGEENRYFDQNGEIIKDEKELEQIKKELIQLDEGWYAQIYQVPLKAGAEN